MTSIRYLVKSALRDGRLVRPQHCDKCKKIKRVIAHHDDYAKPLDIRWLCRSCHQCWHWLNGEGANYHLSGLDAVRSERRAVLSADETDKRCQRMVELSKLGKTLREISNEFNVSRERVRQIIGNPRRLDDWPWDRYGFSPIVDASGNILGCEIVSFMTIEEIKAKYPDAVIPKGARKQ